VIVRDSVSEVRVIERLGFGLDEKAVETIRTWRSSLRYMTAGLVSMRIYARVLFRPV